MLTDRTANRLINAIPIAFGVLVVVLGVLQAADPQPLSMDPDGIAYLDMADAYRTGHWHAALVGLWPPLYAWLLAAATAILSPTAYWEFGVVRLVNFATYLVAARAFRSMLEAFMDDQRQGRLPTDLVEADTWPDWVWHALGRCLFIWTALEAITLQEDSPDMALAAVVYAAVAIIIRQRLGETKWSSYLRLGAVLGLGYMAKGYMLFLAWVFVAVALASARPLRLGLRRGLVILAGFAIVSAPYVIAMSVKKGHLDFGGAGPVNYAFNIDGIPWVHWHGGPYPGMGVPVHPDRELLSQPKVYQYATPIGGTYPLWYDPAYWNEGEIAHFSLRGHVENFIKNLGVFYDVFVTSGGLMIVAALSILLAGVTRRLTVHDVQRQAVVLVPAMAGLAMLLAVHVETTHMGAFVTLFWLGVFGTIRSGSPAPERTVGAIVATCCGLLVVSVCVDVIGTSGVPVARALVHGSYRPYGYQAWDIAQALHDRGLRPGDPVAYVGAAIDDGSWARLARVKIIAEAEREDAGDVRDRDASRASVLRTLRSTGATFAVGLKNTINGPGWQDLPGTGHVIYDLRAPVPSPRP